MIGTAIALGIALLAYSVIAPSLNWSGGVVTEVDVHVFDAISGDPIAGAIVVALDAKGTPSRFNGSGPVTTDSVGRARINMFVGAGGTRSWGYERYGYGDSNRSIQVTATGYLPSTAAPGNAAGLMIVGIKWQPNLTTRIGLKPSASTQPQ